MKSFKEIKASIVKEVKERAVEKSTWVGIITKFAAVAGFSMTGLPIEYLAGMIATYVGGILTAAHTKKAEAK